MANRLRYATSITPIFTHVESEGVEKDVIATDYQKTFSGSAEVTGPAYSLGPTTGKFNIDITSGTIVTTPTSCKGLFIRNRGLDENGDASTATISITFGSVVIAVLQPGGAFFLPSPVSSTAVTGVSSSGTISVEVAVFN